MNLLVALTAFLLLEVALCCTNGFMQLDVLRRRAVNIPNTNTRSTHVLDNELRVIPDMYFTCNGTITSLLLGMDVRTATSSRNEYPEVQIWRKQQGGEGRLLGNLMRLVRQNRQKIRLTAGNFSSDGVLVYNLSPPMQFQSGDTLGVYQPQQNRSVVRLYYNLNDSAPGAIRFNGSSRSSFYLRQPNIIGQYILLSPITEPPCTNGFLTAHNLKRKVLEENISGLWRRRQGLFPDIHFTCNGSITKWIVGAEMVARGGDQQPELQIWRKDSGGGNSYTKTNFSLLTPNETSDPNVHECYPDTPLEFQEGDILGVYQRINGNSQLVVYYQRGTGPENYYNLRPPAPSSFTITKTPSYYDYPLVTVEISKADSTMIVASPATTFSTASTTPSPPLPQSPPLPSPIPPLQSIPWSSSVSTVHGLPLPQSSLIPPLQSLPWSSSFNCQGLQLPQSSMIPLPTQPSLLPSQPSVSMTTLPATPPLGLEIMYTLIGGGVVLVLVMVMVTPIVLIYMCARAKRKRTIEEDQTRSRNRRGSEDSPDTSPVYSKLSYSKAGHAGSSITVTYQHMEMQANPAYMGIAVAANQGKDNQSFPVENDEYQYIYETLRGANIYDTVEGIYY